MSDVVLGSASRSSLLSLQKTQAKADRTQGRLSTGLTVSSVIDDALKYFESRSLDSRVDDLSARKDAIDQAVSSIETVLNAAESLENLTEQIKGLISSARSGDSVQRAAYQKEMAKLGIQIQRLVDDATYKGQSLLNSSAAKLVVSFSEKQESKLTVDGVNMNMSMFFRSANGGTIKGMPTATKLGPAFSQASSFVLALGFKKGLDVYELSKVKDMVSFNDHADIAQSYLDATIGNLRAKVSSFGTSLSVLQVRLSFTKEYANILTDGSFKLKGADSTEEGANLVTLQTRKQLGLQALAMAGQSEQAILGLFR